MFAVKVGKNAGKLFQSRVICRRIQRRHFSGKSAQEKVGLATGLGTISAFIGSGIYFWQKSGKRTTVLAKEKTVNSHQVEHVESFDVKPPPETTKEKLGQRSPGDDNLQEAIQKARDLSQRIKV